MATRLEPPSREDNGLWSLATACSAFRGTERHSSMSPTTESSGSPDSNASRNCRLAASPDLNSSLHCNDADHFCHNDKQCGFEHTRIISPISPNDWSPASPSLTFSIPYNTTLPVTQHKTDRNSLACSQFQSSTNKPSKPAPLQNSRSLFPLLSTLSSNAESVYRTATPPHAP
uniref:Uncharacterized protein n=1 Tax=Ciona savignyi TaxID=51511 RepID=H2Z8B2_CIOSA